MSTARIRVKDWGTRARWEPTRADLRRPLIVVACLLAVFACFVEIGRSTRSTHALPPVYGPQGLPTGSVSVGIPVALASHSFDPGDRPRRTAQARTPIEPGSCASRRRRPQRNPRLQRSQTRHRWRRRLHRHLRPSTRALPSAITGAIAVPLTGAGALA